MKRRKNSLLNVLLFLIVILFVIGFAGNLTVNKWINTTLPEVLNENPDRKYHIEFNSANIQWFKDYIKIEKIVITPINTDTLNQNYAKANIDYFLIERPNITDLLGKKQLITKKLEVGNSDIAFYLTNSSEYNDNQENVNQFWKDVFNRILIEKLELKNASIKMIDASSKLKLASIRNLSICVDGFEIDTTSVKAIFPVKYTSMNITMNDVFLVVDSMYTLSFSKLAMDNSNMQIDNIHFYPVISSTEYLSIYRPKNDLIEFNIKQAQVNRFSWNLEKFLPELRLSSFVFEELDFHTLKDKRFDAQEKDKPMIAQLFRELPLQIASDSFIIRNATIIYEEHPAGERDTTGQLIFDQFYMTGYNLNNLPGFNRVTEFDIETRFMREAKVTCSIDFNIFDINDNFAMRGTIDKLTTTGLNKILQPLAGVETTGNIYQTSFSITGNNVKTDGWLDFEYEDLKIVVMQSKRQKKDWFISSLGNLMLKKKNLKIDPPFKQGQIEFIRDPHKSFFGYLWNSVKSGLLDTLVPFNIQKRKERRAKRKK